MKTCLNFTFLTVTAFGLNSFLAPSATAQQPRAAVSTVLPVELSVIAGKDDKAEGNQGMFEFGTVSMMEPSHDFDGVDPRTLWQHYNLSGLKHIFILQNKTNKSVEVRDFRHQPLIFETQLWKDGKSVGMGGPLTLAPGEKIGVEVAFDYNRAGVAKHTAWLVDVMGADEEKPLATLAMAGTVESGITFSKETLNFGKVAKGSKVAATFSLTFDRRAPTTIPPGALKLVCKNPQVRIYSIPAQLSLMGVQVKGDTIVFPSADREWPKDLILKFGVELSPELPIGSLKEKIALIAQGLPKLSIVKDAILPVQATIVDSRPVLPRK